jgi:hypothetical protein
MIEGFGNDGDYWVGAESRSWVIMKDENEKDGGENDA